MKFVVAVVAMFMAATGRSQNTQTTPGETPPLRDSIESEVNREIWRQSQGASPLFPPTPKANEITINGVTYAGSLVEMAKGNPLQMVNPAAPPQYGSPIDNVTWSLTWQRVTGLRLFSIQF